MGEDGIIKKAELASDMHANSVKAEQDAMDELLQEYANAMAGVEGNGGNENIAVPGKKVTGLNATYTDSNNDTAPIPIGFAVVTDPDTIANGLVISDVENDDMANSKGGNQFVWIPVPDYSKFHLIEGYWNGSLDSMLSSSKEAGSSLTEILPGKPNTANTVLGTTESVAMYKSVEDNKGFYIARFEAGIANVDDEGNPVDNYSLSTKVATDGSVKPLSKKGVGVWNSIAWGGTTTVEASDGLQGNDSADGAVKVARSMYTKSSTCGAQSTLCYGVQWDAVMNFIDSNYYTGTCADDSFVKNSTNKGNHTGSLEETGYYEVNHIYDLAGNVYEWTMEAYDSSYRVFRGGVYNGSGSEHPASVRGSDGDPGYSGYNIRSSCSFILVTLSPLLVKNEVG